MPDTPTPESLARLQRWKINGHGLPGRVVDVPMPTHQQMQEQLEEAIVNKGYLESYGYDRSKE